MKVYLSILFLLQAWTVSAQLSISSVVTGYSKGAIEATVVKGGSWLRGRQLVHQAIIIDHPQGRLLFDTGIAPRSEAALAQASWLDQQLFAVTEVKPLIQQLNEHGLQGSDFKAIIPSHLHWDHTGGLPDFPQVPVWVNQQALAHALAYEGGITYMQSHLTGDINWQDYALAEQEHLGFAYSSDVFNDGSVVLVGLSGHTQGHIGLFVQTEKQHYFFIGDTTWVTQGIDEGQPRPKITHWLSKVDADYDKNTALIHQIQGLQQRLPDLMIVPAHDENVAKLLPRFPEFGG